MPYVGQLLGGFFLQVAFDRFASPELMNFVRRWKIDLVEVESLKQTSAMIQDLSDEAEMKQFTSIAVKQWLDHLKQLFYDAEDILDEYATELLRLRLEFEYQTLPHQTLQEIRRFGSKVRDIDERLNSVAQKGVALGLNFRMGFGSSSRSLFRQTSSLVNRSEVFGREDDKWYIVKWLLSDKTASPSSSDNNFSVLPIVGMGGVGKTTLAQLVYNDETVVNSRYFDLKAWVCVSEDFDEVKLTKEILESATGSSPSSNSLDLLQLRLKEALSRKRFLLVLDDMWNEDYERWYALRTPFAFGKPGSKVLVTTRNKRVSSIVHTDSNDHDHDLKGLSDEACIALFRRHAFMDRNSCDANQKLEVFGQELLKKCKGLPLAVKTLAGLLRGKRENCEWEDIMENEIWDSRESRILPSLMLSYHHLPPLLKRCFEYCALFPKDYVFNKIELVILWMAEGIVQPKSKGKKRLEDIGAEYFTELFMRSFFELSDRRPSNQACPFVMPNNYYINEKFFYDLSNEFHRRSFFESSRNTGSGFVMHDLIHDLAQFVSDGIYCRRDEYDNKSSKVLTTTRHLSYLMYNFNVEVTESEVMRSLRTIIGLREFLHSMQFQSQLQFQFQFQFLRVLRVRNYRNCELPDSIGKLKHLRLLDLSFSDIMRLPDSITSLYNLQTLILSGCWSLKELPEDMGNLINLRHLFLPTRSGGDSYKMPSGVGNLTSLQTLSPYIVGSENGSTLIDLSQLRGTLDISNLENVGNINGTETMVANLKNNPYLLGLRLCWSHYGNKDSFLDLGRDEKVEEDTLDLLQPHTNVEALLIQNYGGVRFPSWMEHPSFSNLETMILINCHKCKILPDLRQLPLLKHLVIDGCSATKMMENELYGGGFSSGNTQFRSLETLCIERMEECEEWLQVVEKGGEGQFPCLHKLIIKKCPKLTTFYHRFPGLVELEIGICDDLRELPWLLPSLRWLSIYCCPKLVVLPSLPSIETLTLDRCERITLFDSDDLSSSALAACTDSLFPCLRRLKILCCPNLRELLRIFPSLKVVPTVLQKLEIRDCKNLMSLSKELHTLMSLQEFVIESCPALVSFQETGLPTALQKLEIRDCKNLELLPKELHTLMSLQEFVIKSCPALVSLQETGLPTGLHKLEIIDCKNLESLPKELHTVTHLQKFVIRSCPALISFQEIGLPNALHKLEIIDCKNLESLPKELHNLTSLQDFVIKSCLALVSFQEIWLPTALQRLEIIDCKNLESLPKDLHTLTSLQEFVIESCSALVSFQESGLPTALRQLRISDCKNLESLPMGILHNLTSLQFLGLNGCTNLKSLPEGLHKLTSLQSLEINRCPALETFPDMGLPTAIWKLSILKCVKLNFLPLHKLTNLQKLEIVECSSLMDCKNKEPFIYWGLRSLITLQSLIIGGCPALVSIPKGMLPTNLRNFYIKDCPVLESLHDGLADLTSLEYLDIRRCPMLTQWFQEKEGEEWSKIAQICRIMVDGNCR